ncbi:putative ABC transport system permease protein [Halovenus aranensis]|uniref:Putative ABC transport system permease protein n=1 Tax=Halovenus aranensis TaxID=890420 RepID=A0A1G8V659_9EURY|nr:ABC transporter permease [Halovenus aranensis]SDJ61558.1 putative ABC transport system permease protein [Halovenus aranensis]
MKLTESLRISWRAITGHKLRSTLTAVGVIIGIAAVIVFMVLGGAFEQNIVQDFEEDDGEPGMWVNTQQVGTGSFQFVTAPIYTETDVENLEAIDGVDFVGPEANLRASQFSIGDTRQTGGFGVQAVSPDQYNSEDLIEGKMFESADEALLTQSLVNMTDGQASVGDQIRVNFDDGAAEEFTVTGIVEGGFGTGPNAAVYLSLEHHYNTTIETPRGTEEKAYSSLIIGAEDASVVDDVKKRATEYFDTESDAAQLKQDDQDIQVQTIDDAVDQITSVIDQLTVFIGGIAGISLVVGSIGIANIMIVSVTERTREIGIMKAVGARKRDIIQLFLIESSILGAVGAFLGVVVGIGVGYLGVTLIGWPMAYPTDWVVIAVVVGLGVGILSGIYPAWRAAKVDPIEALRHE